MDQAYTSVWFGIPVKRRDALPADQASMLDCERFQVSGLEQGIPSVAVSPSAFSVHTNVVYYGNSRKYADNPNWV